MIKIINRVDRNLNDLAHAHFRNLEPTLRNRLASLPLKKRQIQYISTNLERIIIAEPKELLKVNKEYETYCRLPGREKLKNIKQGLAKIFDYGNFSKKNASHYDAYDFTDNLQTNTCAYCNRGYIYTITKGNEKIVRPDIDHFYAKSDYPLLSLSFFNLVPSCLVCNRSLKGKKKTNTCLNPYLDGFGDAMKFNFLPLDVPSAKGQGKKFSVVFIKDYLQSNKVKSCEKNVQLFRLEEIYSQSHGDEISHLINLFEKTGGVYLKQLLTMFPQFGSVQELYRIAFANYLLEEDYEKKPLAKLTRDVMEQLKFTIPEVFIEIK